MNTSKYKVIVVDDHDIFNLGIKVALEKDPSFEIIGEAKNGQQLLDLAKDRKFDLVICDYMLPDKNGIELLIELKKSKPLLKTILISSTEKEHLQSLCIKYGIDAYIFKSEARSKILEKALFVLQNKIVLPFSEPEIKENPLTKLSKKEIEILRLWYFGKSMNETGSLLRINVKTVETHRANIKKKIPGLSKSEIFSLMKESGLV